MNKVELWTLPNYSRVKVSEGVTVKNILRKEFNLLFMDKGECICTTTDGDEFKLPMSNEIEFFSSMKEYDLAQLNNN